MATKELFKVTGNLHKYNETFVNAVSKKINTNAKESSTTLISKELVHKDDLERYRLKSLASFTNMYEIYLALMVN